MNSNKLLIDESPLQVLPSLAEKIGLNEAIVLQQVHYWLRIAEKSKDKRKYFLDAWWTFGTYEDWQKESFPFWSKVTVGRIFRSLEDKKLLLSRQPDAKDWDHKKWYTIDYYQLEAIDRINLIPSDVSDWNEREYQDDTILNRNPETLTETSTIAPNGAPPVNSPPIEKKGDPVDGFLFYAQKNQGQIDLSFLGEHLRPLALAFLEAAGSKYTPLKSDYSFWRKTLNEWYERGITSQQVKEGIKTHLKAELSIKSPASVTYAIIEAENKIYTYLEAA